MPSPACDVRTPGTCADYVASLMTGLAALAALVGLPLVGFK
jgi:hypothetical protein